MRGLVHDPDRHEGTAFSTGRNPLPPRQELAAEVAKYLTPQQKTRAERLAAEFTPGADEPSPSP